jgi:hypothetical protein
MTRSLQATVTNPDSSATGHPSFYQNKVSQIRHESLEQRGMMVTGTHVKEAETIQSERRILHGAQL